MVSDVLRNLISESGKTQVQVASDLGFTQQRFNFYVTGKREPDNETLKNIADYFNVSTDYLLGREAVSYTHLDVYKRQGLVLPP